MFRPPTTTPSHVSGPGGSGGPGGPGGHAAPPQPAMASSRNAPPPAAPASATAPNPPLTTLDPSAFDFFSSLESILALVQEGNNPAAVGSAIYDLKRQYDEALAILDRVPEASKSIREVQDQLAYRQEQLCERKQAYHEYHAMASKALLPAPSSSTTNPAGSGLVGSAATSVDTSFAGEASSVAPSTIASPTSTLGFGYPPGHSAAVMSEQESSLLGEESMDVDPSS